MKKIFFYPGPLWPVTAILSVIVLLVTIPIWGSIILSLALLNAPLHWVHYWVRSWNLTVLRVFFISVRVRDLADYDPHAPRVIVSNHQGLFDIPAAFFVFTGIIRMLAKKELFYIPIFGHCLKQAGFVPVDRGNRASGRSALEAMKKLLERGVQVWVAPEGTRSPSGELGPFKSGGLSVAIDSQIPVQPIVVHDSRHVLPKAAWLPRVGRTIHVTVLPSIATTGMSHESRGELAERVRNLMSETLTKGYGA